MRFCNILRFCLIVVSCIANIAVAAEDSDQTTLEKRSIESRQFNGVSSKVLISASINVLQDMGFNIDEADAALGTVTASKSWAPDDPLGLRDAKGTFSVPSFGPLALLSALFETHRAYVENFKQDYRASLVVKQASSEPTEDSASSTKSTKKTQYVKESEKKDESKQLIVRILFEKTSKFDKSKTPNEDSPLSYSETVKDPTLYQAFFQRLSKSVFLEEQQL